MGRRLGKAIVWPCQWLNLFGALVSVFIQGGLSFKVRLAPSQFLFCVCYR